MTDDLNAYGRGPVGRTSPGERRVKIGADADLHAIPTRDRLLTISCSAVRGRQPRPVGIVTRAEVWMPSRGRPVPLPRGGWDYTKCACEGRAHKIDLSKVYEAVDRLRHQPQKARVVDVEAFLYR